ncbi:MAG: PspA/IM30 family protein [Eggerthellaceae bacterium]|nr:PspA/IM30 family protein [Eggerthellaceae bacterium]
MGILSRFSEIIKANVNDLLDKAEDPQKMIDQYMRDLTQALAEVKEETAGVMAEEARAKRLVEVNQEDIDKYTELAKKALAAGNEGDARALLTKKQQFELKGKNLEQAYESAKTSAQKMRQMHDKLIGDIYTLKERREAIRAKVAVAKTQEKVNKFSEASDKAEGAMGAFDRMEEKADKMLDKANAVSDLNAAAAEATQTLEEKYAVEKIDAAVESELAAMKAELGLA